jgi:hypothetical protein
MSEIVSAIQEIVAERRRNEAEAAAARAAKLAAFKECTPTVRKILSELGDRKWGKFPLRSLRYSLRDQEEDFCWILSPQWAFLREEVDEDITVRLFKKPGGGPQDFCFQVDAVNERLLTSGLAGEDLEKTIARVVHWLF